MLETNLDAIYFTSGMVITPLERCCKPLMECYFFHQMDAGNHLNANYFTKGMLETNLDAICFTRGMLETTLDANYSIGGML